MAESKTSLTKKYLIVAAGVILVLILAAPSLYFYNKYQQAQNLLSNPSTLSQNEIKALTEKVGKLIEIPTDEEPTIATVTDLERLKEQPFFQNAKVGYKVLIYNNAKKAILYDPVANKIIEVGPLVISSPAPIATESANPAGTSATVGGPTTIISPSPTIAKTVSLVLYNGTATVGLTKKVEDLLLEKAPFAQVVSRDNASKKDYSKTLIINLTTNKKDELEDLAKIIGAEVSPLPAGEAKPAGADFLVIVGEDKK